MTDLPDPSRLLASAALDDEVTPDERALIETSPELLAELETYRSLRTEMAAVEVPAAAREAAIAAALAEFDATQPKAAPRPDEGEVVTPIAPVVPLARRRRRQLGWLTGVAAAALIGVVAVGVTQRDDSSNKTADAPLRTTVAAATTAPATTAAAATTAPADAAGAADTDGGSANKAPSLPPAAAASEPAAETIPEILAEATEAASETMEAPIPYSTDPWANAPDIDSREALIAYLTSTPELATTAGAATTVPVTTTAAATTAAPTTAAASDTTASADSVEPADVNPNCLTPTVAWRPVVYESEHVYLIPDDAGTHYDVYDPSTCEIVDSIDLP
jgi:hypothetical protein